MKNNSKCKIKIVMFLIFACLSLDYSVLHAETIVLSGIDWCPYICKSNSKYSGFLVDIAEIAFSKVGKISYKFQPWNRSISNTKTGKITGLIGVIKKNAPTLVYPKEEQAFTQVRFFVRQDNSWEYTGLVSLKKVQLGVIQNYSYGEMDSYIRKYSKTRYVQPISGENAISQNIKLLRKKRISAILIDYMVMDYTLKKNNELNIFREAGKLIGNNVYIAFSPKNPKSKQYAKLLSNTMHRLRSSGRLSKILKHYGLKDWKK